MKKLLFLLCMFTASLSHANESCLFPPCPEPPTQEEIKTSDIVFNKTKYILGAAFDIQNKNNGTTYKNIPDFVNKTNKIKTDLKALIKQAESLNIQAGRIEMVVSLNTIDQCISFDQSAIQYCSQALNELKSYLWNKTYSENWSNYPVLSNWKGFPKSMQ